MEPINQFKYAFLSTKSDRVSQTEYTFDKVLKGLDKDKEPSNARKILLSKKVKTPNVGIF